MNSANCIFPQSEQKADTARLKAKLYDAMMGTCRLQVLRERPDSQTLRLSMGEAKPVVVKLWKRPGWRGALRRLTGTDNARREWRALRELGAAGLPVPRGIAICRLQQQGMPYTDALFLEDLGNRPTASAHLKQTIESGSEEARVRFEEQVLALTVGILRAGFVDPDHGFHNMLVSARGEPVRLDFELATRVGRPAWYPEPYGQMLGRLLSTYVYAVQPDTGLAVDFALRMAATTGAPQAGRHWDIKRRSSEWKLTWLCHGERDRAGDETTGEAFGQSNLQRKIPKRL